MMNGRRSQRLSPLGRFLIFVVVGVLLVRGMPSIAAIAQSQFVAPPALITQGTQAFEQGDFQAALEYWQQAEKAYQRQGDQPGEIGSRLNQAKAWQNLGFYRRAKEGLEQILPLVQAQPATELQAQVWLEYGNLLRLVGDLTTAQRKLETSLEIAQSVGSHEVVQAAQLQLGNVFLAQHNHAAALPYFQQAAASPSSAQLAAQLRQLQVLQVLNRTSEAIALLPVLETHLAQLPPSHQSVYGYIKFASLLPASSTSPLQAAALLATAIQQAKRLNHVRAESYATGQLAKLYEQGGQWQEANRLTRVALQQAKRLNLSEDIYQWQWQLGRILKTENKIPEAIAAYTEAVNLLRSLRQDLTALAPDVQFSFRDEVEPVYRELVDLLLQPNATQAQLKQARQVVESLQLAELNNFFREACIEAEARQIDQIDASAAVIYPVILSDRLEIILSLPGQPLRHVATSVNQRAVEAGIQQMRVALRRTAFGKERQVALGQMYNWLIQPIAADLAQSSPKTLVFVLDGALRSLPMAALYDGKHYLIEQYQIANTPGLQLMSPRTFSQKEARGLIAGLSESRAGAVPLPGVKREIEIIQQYLPSQVLANEKFTGQALKERAVAVPFNVLHLATHGKFGATVEETYLQTWDGRLTVDNLRTVLSQRSLQQQTAVELLVLSACETAEGNNRAALGMAGLAVRSGARSTLATLWAVNDDSTAQFMTQFYQQLAQPQVGKAEAVRNAQLALLQTKSFNHPYFWAPFILVGNWL